MLIQLLSEQPAAALTIVQRTPRQSLWIGPALAVWLTALGTVLLIGARRGPRPGTRCDAASRRFFLPGSASSLITVLAIFLLKYGIGVEMAMQADLRHDASFALPLAALYGTLTGLFARQALALWRLARQS